MLSRKDTPSWQRRLVKEVDENELRSNKTGDVAQFGHYLSRAALENTNGQLQLQILRQLDFPDRHDRSDRIPKAHQQTFQWIYASQPELKKRNLQFSSFAGWLESDDPLYWITGKPGSGKSTLMKFIVTDPRTRHHLQSCTQGQRLVIASFYFWNSGSEAQMSEAGMLRTLLYEALSQWPEQIPHLFPNRWNLSKLVGADRTPWTVEELRSALDVFVNRCAGVRKLCFFVDGLDECSEQHEKLANLFIQYLSVKGFKCCLASRPWPVFEDAFCARASLMLQDLTLDDILLYAKDKLCGSRGFAMLEANEPEYASRLVLRIGQKASGVYLWVRLVVDSLLSGLSNCDRIADLEKRLDEIPGDLEELYEKMLRSIERFYAGHASQFFQIIRESQGTATALMLSFADESGGSAALKANAQPLSDEMKTMRYETVKKRLASRCKGFLEIPKPIEIVDASPQEPVHGDSENQAKFHHQTQADQANPVTDVPRGRFPRTYRGSRRTLGEHRRDLQLLRRWSDRQRTAWSPEIPGLPDESESESDVDESLPTASDSVGEQPPPAENECDRQVETNAARNSVHPADLKIAYLHRTARDFLERPDIWSMIMADSPKDFNVQETVMQSFICMLNTSQLENASANSKLITWCLQYIETVGMRFESVPFQEMESITKAATSFCNRLIMQANKQIEDEVLTEISKHGESGFLLIAARYNLQSFIQKKLQSSVPIFPGQPKRPLLDCVIGDYLKFPSLCERSQAGGVSVPHLEFIQQLLSLGHDPNLPFAGKTPWERVLLEARRIARDETSIEQRKHLLLHWAKITGVFLKHNADPYANKNGASGNAIREAFGHDFPKVALALEKRLTKSQRAWKRLGKFLPFTKDASTSGLDLIPLFREIQLQNAQIPGASTWEHYQAYDKDPKSKNTGLLGALKRFEPSK